MSNGCRSLGPLLGSLHPLIQDNATRLKEISGLDEVSFHMSGTEAVMQAVRLARFHTSRSHLVRFCGAYHGWWDDVQPGIGTPATVRVHLHVEDMSRKTLDVLDSRRDIACVLVNPLQALHPNAGAPADGTLWQPARALRSPCLSSWLQELRAICTRRVPSCSSSTRSSSASGVAYGGAQEYFGVRGRPGDLRQNARRRASHRRGLWARRAT